MPEPIVGMDLADLGKLLGPTRPAYRARQAYQAIYRAGTSDLVQITTLPAAVREDLTRHHELGLPKVAQRYESVDGTRRYLLLFDDGRTVETVLMPEADRDTLCISSQVGCPVDCKFCMTALLGLERSLTAGEIVGQVLHVAAAHNLTPTDTRMNVVMRGRGEPLLNLANVIKATRLLTDPEGVAISPRRITL